MWRASDVSEKPYHFSETVRDKEIILFFLQGVMCRSLEEHAHWVNHLALNCDHVLRLGPFDPVLHPRGTIKNSKSSEKN